MNENYAKVKAWRARNPDKVLAQAQRYRERHPETNQRAKAKYRESNLSAIRERDRLAQEQRRKADPEGQRRRNQAYLERKRLRQEQEAGRPAPSCCELCGELGRIVFDHCHSYGHFRGWLCDRCNRVLGAVKDSRELLGKMIAYLERTDGSPDR